MKTQMNNTMLETEVRDNSIIISLLVDEIEIGEASTLVNDITEILKGRNDKLVVIDLSHVKYIDSFGVSSLVMLKRRLQTKDIDMTVVCDSKSIVKVFDLLHISKFLTVYPTVNSVFMLNPSAHCA